MKSLLICGGVGGAKLAYGFYNFVHHDAFDILVNTGDDFIHLGLHVSPDLDTVIYTLSEEVEVSQGWGRQNESWNMLNELKTCLLYTSPSPRDRQKSRMPSSA